MRGLDLSHGRASPEAQLTGPRSCGQGVVQSSALQGGLLLPQDSRILSQHPAWCFLVLLHSSLQEPSTVGRLCLLDGGADRLREVSYLLHSI